ncbi:hypothetical protein [Achromobacter xylosoxidans]|jgi:hypothetical protein|uniref:Uncharacterized protein n=2 Tax=Alcaligenes xylosoxydans xylosoxydans TaxID=85698 RepID=A0A1R1JR31_ALCXX|nr:hypothetical protein [Achromobacter xylosoxidans]MCH4592324.1 hypothetical protein [Achromobacter xylosoxidans]MDH0518798.1 hypothetical protein [Achromobacter xylosoxidans]MDH0543084.1 hypothetical protein [Achromobacter xylosoxidans]OMG83842.1 hypothetical protein BIZ92_29715 [Achromobacter xylosoxidans]CCH07016.1 hypothetical protein NH44784_030561 [Achromobacter xylosoxidans NH44784-1996]
MRLSLQRHRCVSLLPLARTAHRRLDDFFAVQYCSHADELPADTAALIVGGDILSSLQGGLPARIQSVTVVGSESVPSQFVEQMKARRVLVTWPRVAGAEDEQEAMEICHDVMAAFGFGRMGSRPRNVVNDVLLCDCC